MTAEQIAAILATIVGAPVLIELVKKWFEGRNLNFQSKGVRDDREWKAMEDAIDRERKVYAEILIFERAQFAARLSDIEARLATIHEEAKAYQKLYWEERVVRERLQLRVESLEAEVGTRSYKNVSGPS